MEIIEYYKAVLSKYAIFEGRARRKEYWYFTLAQFIISIVPSIIVTQIKFLTILGIIYTLAMFVPVLAVTVRRLHDINRSGLYILFALIPIAGSIILIIWLAKEGDAGDNQYGPDPKAAQLAAV
jgi:uncharacterized membrane protein YhaH (DUF805 family)